MRKPYPQIILKILIKRDNDNKINKKKNKERPTKQRGEEVVWDFIANKLRDGQKLGE